MNSQNRKIALFGGTFDPVHIGHLHLATLAQEALALDEVRFLPCRISPHKQGQPPASGADRCAMLRLATAHLAWAVIDETELNQEGISYSYKTAESQAKQFPNSQLYWIMGGDQWTALPQWKHPERLAKCVEFIVLARGAEILPQAGFKLHIIRGDHPASASMIRNGISLGAAESPWLPTPVAQWIKEKNLYRDGFRRR